MGTFPHPPRLEPCLRLSPHTAQHFQISLGLCSVAWSTDGLEVVHAISLLKGFELCAKYDVIHLYFAGMEWLSLAETIWALDCTYRSFEEHHFFS